MTIQDKGTRIQALASGGQTEFTFPFDIFAESDLNVYLTPVGQPSDPTGDLLPPSAYVITLNDPLPSDGKITLNTPATAGDIITQERDTPLARSTDFATAGDFRANEVNKQLDKLTAQIQQVETLIETRGVTYAVTDDLSSADNILPQLEPDTVWYKNGAGNIVAVDINGGDVNTLKAELASQTMAAPGSGIVGHYSTLLSAGITVEAQLNNNEAQIDTNTAAIAAIDALYIKSGVLRGLNTNNNTTLPLKDIDFTPGVVADSTLSEYMELPTLLVKKIDAVWAAGTNMGGLFTGAVAANTTYHLFIIKHTDGTVDAGFDTSVIAANRPVGYTKFARVLSLYTDSGSNLVQYEQRGNKVILKAKVADFSGATTVAATLHALSVPKDIEVLVNFNARLVAAVVTPTVLALVSSPLSNDDNPATLWNLVMVDSGTNTTATSIILDLVTNTLGEVRSRANAAVTDIELTTYGWNDNRGGESY
jgi:hypothetical protein